ncbi:MAG: hypothetical protein Kow0020_10650 [Wenzhouxiangellaceae bacterium]
MDKELKRRLIGASILIALAVIFVPMLLVGPSDPDAGHQEPVEIPAMPDEAREVRRIPLDPRALEPAAEPVGTGADDRSGGERFADRLGVADEIVLHPDAVPQQAESGNPEPAAAAGSDADDQAASADAIQAPVEEPPSVPASRPEPATRAEPSTPVAQENWAVQVASLSSEAKAQAIRDRLERLGHIVIREEIVRGDTRLVRLRTGPYPSESAARSALAQIAATVEGVEPIVVQLDADDAHSGAAASGGFVVQTGSFTLEQNAQAETERLQQLGFPAFRRARNGAGRTVWQVLVGPVASEREAEQLRKRLAEQAGVEGLVRSEP